MTKSKRLRPVVKIAQDRERQAAIELGKSQQVVDQRRARLEELQNYREEYHRRYATMQHARNASQLTDFLAFLARLDHIISEQGKLVAAALADFEARKREWMATRSKAGALDKAVERLKREETALINRREQKESDELAQRARPGIAGNEPEDVT